MGRAIGLFLLVVGIGLGLYGLPGGDAVRSQSAASGAAAGESTHFAERTAAARRQAAAQRPDSRPLEKLKAAATAARNGGEAPAPVEVVQEPVREPAPLPPALAPTRPVIQAPAAVLAQPAPAPAVGATRPAAPGVTLAAPRIVDTAKRDAGSAMAREAGRSVLTSAPTAAAAPAAGAAGGLGARPDDSGWRTTARIVTVQPQGPTLGGGRDPRLQAEPPIEPKPAPNQKVASQKYSAPVYLGGRNGNGREDAPTRSAYSGGGGGYNGGRVLKSREFFDGAQKNGM